MERSIMIQYTGTSSRSNYNDERTATIGWPATRASSFGGLGVGSGKAYPPRSPLLVVFLFFLFPSPFFALLLLYSLLELLSFSLFLPLFHSQFLVYFIFGSTYLFLPTGLPVSAVRGRIATRANIFSGVVTGPRSHGGWIGSEPLSRSTGIITGATVGVRSAGSASSARYTWSSTVTIPRDYLCLRVFCYRTAMVLFKRNRDTY